MTKRRYPIIIHGLDHARAAAAASLATGVPIRLESAPGAAGYGGAAWFREIIARVRFEYPDADLTDLLDCGDAPGHALAALRAGLPAIRFHGPRRVREKIAAIARQCGATVESGADSRARPVLDLDGARDAEAACFAWLSGDSAATSG